MTNKIIMVSGGAAVGKTALLKHLLPRVKQESAVAVCKIDCIFSQDKEIFENMDVPCVQGLSADICPDHFLVSNYMELISWSDSIKAEMLFIETAGLCNRCSPATEKSLQICVIDATSSCKAPKKLGPMLSNADMIAISKIDLVSQAEREILIAMMRQLNENAALFPFDGISGYGTELLAQHILKSRLIDSFEGDILRHTMPAGVCSYCIGERRIGACYQQGVVGKIDFGGMV
ncbi:MAG: GTP-binding protein [Candidatus Fimivivens sp.]